MTIQTDRASTTRDLGDWRVLLPGPPHGDVLWISGTDVPEANLDQEYDLVVATGSPPSGWRGSGPSGWDLATLVSRLRPGGSLYLEVRRWAVIARPSRIRRELRRYGLITTGIHAAIPDAATARVLIPVDDSRPALLYVRDLLWGGSRTRRVLRTVVRRLAMAGRMDVVVRSMGITAVRSDERPGPTTPRQDRSLVAAASQVAFPQAVGGTWLLQRPGHSVASPVIVRLWRDAADRDGTVLAKVGVSEASRARIVHEQHALQQLGPYRSDTSVAVPTALGSFTWGDEPVTLESAVPGRPVPQWLADRPRWTPTSGGPWDAWVAWLARVQARSARPMTADDLRTFILDPLATAGTLAGADADAGATARLARLAAEAASRHERAPLVVVTAHHDLGPSNVLVDDHGQPIGVVDWESSGPGLPATDLVYFIAQLADILDPGGLDRSPAPLVTDQWVRSYLSTLAVDPDWLPTLAIAAWVMHARNEAGRDTAAHPNGDRPARDRLFAALTRAPGASLDQDPPATAR